LVAVAVVVVVAADLDVADRDAEVSVAVSEETILRILRAASIHRTFSEPVARAIPICNLDRNLDQLLDLASDLNQLK
jgi:hypothetical protein